MSEWVLILLTPFLIILWIGDMKDYWMSWKMKKLENLDDDQLHDMGFCYIRQENNDTLYMFENQYIFRIHGSFTVRTYIVSQKDIHLNGTMEMKITNLSKRYRKQLYKNIKKSCQDPCYQAPATFKKGLLEEIERCYKRYTKIRRKIYGGTQLWEK